MNKSPNSSGGKSPRKKNNLLLTPEMRQLQAKGAARELCEDPHTNQANRLLAQIDEICADDAGVLALTQRFRGAFPEYRPEIAAALYAKLAAQVQTSNNQIAPVTATGA